MSDGYGWRAVGLAMMTAREAGEVLRMAHAIHLALGSAHMASYLVRL